MLRDSMYLWSVIALALVVLPACAFQQAAGAAKADAAGDVEADIAAVNEIWNQYTAGANTGDLELWLSLWDDDGVRLAPDTPAVYGKEQIRAQMQIPFEQFTNKIAITNEEVEVAGDWAFSRGTYTLSITPKAGGEEIFIDGKYMTILKRQPDGTWKIYRDIFNSNVPPSSDSERNGFPTGTLVSTDGIVAVEFHEDGTCRWYSVAEAWEVPCKYAVNGDLYTEMTFVWSSGRQVPATYYWTYDGENLTFELWGEDMRPHRQSVMDGQTYVKAE